MKVWYGWPTFIRGIRTMRPRVWLSWHWRFGPFWHWEPGFHFHSAGIALGPLICGLWDTDNKE
jgi:hypothetical protein